MGGLWAIWAIRMNLAGSIKEAIIGIKGGQVKSKKRTDKDVSFKLIFIFIVLMTIPVFLLYLWLSNMFGISLIMAIITIFFAFFCKKFP